jgi:hypothetical protein
MVVLFGTLLAFSIITAPRELLPQGFERDKGRGDVHVFKGNAVERSTPGAKPAPPPSPLSVLDLKKLAGSEPGSVFVKVTPKDPSVANRGALVFVTPTLVEGGENYAVWGQPKTGKPHLYSNTELDKIKEKMLDVQHESGNSSGQGGAVKPAVDGFVMLWLRSAASRKYLIDCVVGGSPFLVSGPAGSQITQLNQATGHLIFALEAATAGWYSFRISGSEFGWTFYSCEVTNL